MWLAIIFILTLVGCSGGASSEGPSFDGGPPDAGHPDSTFMMTPDAASPDGMTSDATPVTSPDAACGSSKPMLTCDSTTDARHFISGCRCFLCLGAWVGDWPATDCAPYGCPAEGLCMQ